LKKDGFSLSVAERDGEEELLQILTNQIEKSELGFFGMNFLMRKKKKQKDFLVVSPIHG